MDLSRLLRLPAEALQKLWQVLAPSLAERLSPETERLLDVFCAAYKVDDEDLARAVKACRFLIRGRRGATSPPARSRRISIGSARASRW